MAGLILHVAETLRGGTASYIEEILPAQRQAFGDARLALLVPGDQLGELPSAQGLNVYSFSDRGGRIGHVLSMIFALRRLFGELKPDIVHAQGTFAGVAVRLAALLWRSPAKIIYCAHGWAFDREGARWKRRLVARIEALLAPLADAIVCISRHDYEAALAAGLPAHKLVTIPNAIARVAPVDFQPEWPPGRRRFVFVGRLDRQKGADVFLAAMQRLGDDAFAYLVGSSVIGKQESQLVLPANTVSTGWLPRQTAQAYMASADVVVVPSRWEGFGLTALEAMRAGRPVIASCVGGLTELVSDGMTGRLVEPDSVYALTAALREAVQEDWSGWGEAGFARFEQFYTADRLNNDLLQLYRRLSTQPGQPLPQVSQSCG